MIFNSYWKFTSFDGIVNNYLNNYEQPITPVELLKLLFIMFLVCVGPENFTDERNIRNGI